MDPSGRRAAFRFGKVGGTDEWITDRSLSWVTAATFAREPHCLSGAGANLNIMSQWQDLEILLSSFCYRSTVQEIRLHAVPLVPKFVNSS